MLQIPGGLSYRATTSARTTGTGTYTTGPCMLHISRTLPTYTPTTTVHAETAVRGTMAQGSAMLKDTAAKEYAPWKLLITREPITREYAITG